MNRLEILIILAILLALVIWFFKSKRFDNFLNWLLGSDEVNAQIIKNEKAYLEKREASLKDIAERQKKYLEEQQKELEKVKI